MLRLMVVVLSLTLTGCLTMVTKEELRNTGRQMEEVSSDLPLPELEEKISAHLQKCYKTSYIKYNGTLLGGAFFHSKIPVKGGVEIYVTKPMGYPKVTYYFIINLTEDKSTGKTKIKGSAYDYSRAAEFDKIKEIAKGESPKCAWSIF